MEAVNVTPVQARSEEEGMRYFRTVNEAFRFVEENPSFWKISFGDFDGKRVRLVRRLVYRAATEEYETVWKSEPTEDEIRNAVYEDMNWGE